MPLKFFHKFKREIILSGQEIFDFCLDPKNTPKWVNSIIVEQTNEWPPKVGTIYRNQNKNGVWFEYKVLALEPSVMFEFTSTASSYHVRYTLRSVNANMTELEYFEWMEEGELEEPFTLDTLQKLTSTLES